MKLMDAIAEFDARQFNTVDTEQKVKWLERVDQRVFQQIIKTHENPAITEFPGYGTEDAELLIPEPYSTAYIWWLEAQVHLLNKEYDDYNNAVLLYNKEFEDYARWYTRTHMPLAVHNDFHWGG